MGWEDDLFALFDDLEGQASALWEADREAELADRAQAEYAAVSLASRLMASTGDRVALDLPGLGRVEGALLRVGEDWCLLGGDGGRGSWVVPLGQVVGVHGASPRSVPEVAWSPVHRLGLRSALRRLAGAGARCLVHLTDGSRLEAELGRVGKDFAEVTTAAGETVLVPWVALVAVQDPDG
jgi:hypothetical protein